MTRERLHAARAARLRFLAITSSFPLAHACAVGANLEEQVDSTPTAGTGGSPEAGAPAGGVSGTPPVGGSPSTTTGGSAGQSGGGVPTANGGQPAADAGSSPCPNADEKSCGGLCVAPTVDVGCAAADCTPCPTVDNGDRVCTAGACDFTCNGAFVRSGSACVLPGTADGGPTTGADAQPPGSITFAYAPTNFDPAALAPEATPLTTILDCGESTFDTTSMTFGNWCGQTEPTPVVQTQSGGGDAVVVPFQHVTLTPGATLRVTGSLPAIFAVFGNATVQGVVDASANGVDPGPGGNLGCGTSQGGDGSGNPTRLDGASGGGGGGFGTQGGSGGIADTDGSDVPGGTGGETRGTATLAPLIGGCAGGLAGGCATAGGGGGGAVQLSVAGTLSLTGTVRANGADGSTPCGANDEGGGTGGGSGGGILLEATTLDIGGGTTEAFGGRGGANGQYAGIYNCGGNDGGLGSTDPSTPGGGGGNCQGGSPGGGGGYGRISTIQH